MYTRIPMFKERKNMLIVKKKKECNKAQLAKQTISDMKLFNQGSKQIDKIFNVHNEVEHKQWWPHFYKVFDTSDVSTNEKY